jgi:hypothetical protein
LTEKFVDYTEPDRARLLREMAVINLVKSGMNPEEVIEIVKKLHIADHADYTDEHISNEVYEYYDLANKNRQNGGVPISKRVSDFVNVVNGVSYNSLQFRLQDIYNELGFKTPEEKTSCRMQLTKLAKQGRIEHVGNKSGVYRVVQKSIDVMDWLNAPTNDFTISLPLNIHNLVTLYPANIIIVAGSSNAGKTAFLLNTIRMNMKYYPVYYFNSEMGETELRLRLSLFDEPLESWKFSPIERAGNYQDLITGEKAIFIIDFLEVTKDFYEVAGTLSEIHQKLKDGIAIIALQKKSGQDIGRGGEGTLEKARLYLSLDRDADSNICKIVKAKAWRDHEKNPNGKTVRFSLIKGSKILKKGDWI